MKIYFFNLCLLALLLSCSPAKEAGDREQEIASLESEMIDFFQKTLKQNYGSEDAVDLLMKGMDKYSFNYLLEVDKQQLQKINEKLYSEGWLYSYFLDESEMNDSCSVFVPKGVSIQEYRQTPEYQQELKNRNLDDSSVRLVVMDSVQYMYARGQVVDMILPFKKYQADGFSYFQRELSHASHPILKEIINVEDAVGVPSSMMMWGGLFNHVDSIRNDFKSDRDLQMYLTLYFWKYLCHYANIDFYTGNDRTVEVMKETGHL